MALSGDKKRVACSLSLKDIERLKQIYENHSNDSAVRIYESDTISEMIKYVFEMEQRGENEWRK